MTSYKTLIDLSFFFLSSTVSGRFRLHLATQYSTHLLVPAFLDYKSYVCYLFLSRYCKVFQYVLRLKRIQLELEKSWADAMQQDRADCAKLRKDPVNGLNGRQHQQQRMAMWRIRQHMSYLITNLQFYIQA